MKKPAIPAIPKGNDRSRFDQSIKENIEAITGIRGDKILALDANASLSDVIAKVNQIIEVLQ